jgi:cyclophilin family peptidyl-prolyl cis-trans isomerase/HEAT repeat protein
MGSESVDGLLDLASDPVPGVRASALRTLARIDPDTFMSTLAGLEPDRDWTVRSAVAEALGTVPPERSLARLTEMLGDRDQRVVPAVVQALGATRAAQAESLIVERLKADDFVVREAAATALAAMKAADAVPALVEAYRSSVTSDSTYVARAAMLTALNQLSPPTARPLLQEALHDKDWAVRVKAADLLRAQGVTESVAQTIRPAAEGRPISDPAWTSIVAPQYSPHAFIDTDKGTVEIELAVLDAPLTVNNFLGLARRGFFNGTTIHRVVPDFVVQDGDPRGDGEGGPGYTIRDELNERPYLRGTVGMALDWRDTGGSQFFITYSPQPHLDARYTVFGVVVNGMEVVDRLVRGDVIRRVRIWDGVTESK